MKFKYDISIVYRVYPGISKQPLIYKTDKYKLSKTCLKSFRSSLGDLKAKVWVLMDGCPDEYEDLFLEILDNVDIEIIRLSGESNVSTFLKQIEILINQEESEYVYFSEDDYFYLPSSLQIGVNFLKNNHEVDFVTLYDNSDYYQSRLHFYNSKIKICNLRHWRNNSCTTLSFLTTKRVLNETRSVFESFAKDNLDASLWMSLTKMNLFQFSSFIRFLRNQDRDFVRILKAWLFCWKQILFGKKYNLWSPIPSLATHLEQENISPIIDWKQEVDKNNPKQ